MRRMSDNCSSSAKNNSSNSLEFAFINSVEKKKILQLENLKDPKIRKEICRIKEERPEVYRREVETKSSYKALLYLKRLAEMRLAKRELEKDIVKLKKQSIL